VSAFYEIRGTVRVRKCHEVNIILSRLDDYCMEIELIEDPHDPGAITISVDGGRVFN
jgi:hypothetical protein